MSDMVYYEDKRSGSVTQLPADQANALVATGQGKLINPSDPVVAKVTPYSQLFGTASKARVYATVDSDALSAAITKMKQDFGGHVWEEGEVGMADLVASFVVAYSKGKIKASSLMPLTKSS